MRRGRLEPGRSRPRRTTLSLLGLVSVVTTGCLAEGEPSVEADIELDRSLVPVVTLGADLDESGFSDVRGYGVDSQGRIWVGEYGGFVHVFEPDGRLIRTWERLGEGPGEFGNILALATDPERGRIAVRDGARMTILTEELEELTRWFIPRELALGYLPGVRFEPGRATLLLPVSLPRDSVVADTLRLVWTPGFLLRASEHGMILDTIGSLIGGWSVLSPGISSRSRPPTAGREIWLPVDTVGTLLGDGHRTYELHLVSPQGDTILTFGRSLPREGFRAVPGPEFTQGYVQRVAYDSPRREFLVCRTQPEGGGGNFDPVDVDYFSWEGEYLGTLVWQGCPTLVGPDGTIFLNTRGEFGVPVVLGFRYAGES